LEKKPVHVQPTLLEFKRGIFSPKFNVDGRHHILGGLHVRKTPSPDLGLQIFNSRKCVVVRFAPAGSHILFLPKLGSLSKHCFDAIIGNYLVAIQFL